jgi:heme/copper-type cytochrome/quinol oxidase subunit 1
VPVFMLPPIYMAYDVRSGEFRGLMTWLMQFGGALPMLPFMLAMLIALRRARPASASERPLRSALIASVLLFGVGGVFAFLIQGSNTRIPAHYHGSIVGITLALMGLCYYLLPRFGYRAPDSKLAFWQPYVYAGGQLLHISGLAWAGGHGAERKVAGAAQVLASAGDRVAMGVMGVGGLIAIIGGILFLVIVLRAAFAPRATALAPADGR